MKKKLNKNYPVPPKRKKDIVSILAISLFVLTFVFEFFFIFWLPSRLNSDKRWEKEVALEETTELLDLVRANVSSIGMKNKSVSGETDMAKDCLDDYARYMRENKELIGEDHIAEIYSKLIEFERAFKHWKAKGAHSKDSEIDVKFFIQSQFYRI